MLELNLQHGKFTLSSTNYFWIKIERDNNLKTFGKLILSNEMLSVQFLDQNSKSKINVFRFTL